MGVFGCLRKDTTCRWVTRQNDGGWTECPNARASESRHCEAHRTPKEQAHLEAEKARAEKEETEELEKLDVAALAKMVMELRKAAKQTK